MVAWQGCYICCMCVYIQDPEVHKDQTGQSFSQMIYKNKSGLLKEEEGKIISLCHYRQICITGMHWDCLILQNSMHISQERVVQTLLQAQTGGLEHKLQEGD